MDSGGSGGVTEEGDQRSAENRGGTGDRISLFGDDGGCSGIRTRTPSAYEVRRRRVGCLVRVALIAGLDGVSGKEKKDDVHNPVRFRRAGAGSEDELGGGHQCRISKAVAEIMRVATTSSNLKGTFIKTLKDAASYITAAWMYEMKKSGTTRNSGAAAMRFVDTRLFALQEDNAALAKN
jgi:hypothetical protein